MTLKADLAIATINAIQDIRCSAVRLGLEDILLRRNFSLNIPKFRVYVKNTETPVIDFQDLITHISENSILVTHDMSFVGGNFRDKCKPVTVLLNNLEVRLLPNIDEDNYFTVRYGKDAKTIAITLNYVSDNDTVLPLKAIDAQVVPLRFGQ